MEHTENMRDMFDSDFYKKKYGAKFQGDAFEHYINKGWAENYMPNPFIDPAFYAKVNNIELVEPLGHLEENWRTVEIVSPAFDAKRYLEFYYDIVDADISPFRHFLSWGCNEGRVPGILFYEFPGKIKKYPEFDWRSVAGVLCINFEKIDHKLIWRYMKLIDEEYYLKRNNPALGRMTVCEHYTAEGFRYGLKPNPFFDVTWYARQHQIERENPLLHCVLTTKRPNPFFCAKSYLKANPDIDTLAAAFPHFVSYGARENRELGISSQVIAAFRKIEPDFEWQEAEASCSQLKLSSEPSKGFVGDIDREMDELPSASIGPDDMQINAIKLRARGKEVISFDIWDTILRRECDPDEIKLCAATVLLREFERRVGVQGLAAEDLYRLRQLAEYRVADAHYEYTHAAMMREWVRLAGMVGREAEEVVAIVTNAEVEREKAVTKLDPTIAQLLRDLSGMRMIAISDFYLSEKAMRELFAFHGIEGNFSAIYVSSDHMMTKREGALFDYVLRKEEIKPKKLLHVGDNMHADVVIPQKKGIDAFHFIDEVEEKRKTLFRETFGGLLARDRRALFKTINRILPVVAAKKGDSARVALSSLDILSILFASFGLFIIQRACASKINKVFFATREGLFFKKVYDLLVRMDILEFGTYPESAVIEVSRRATFAPSLRRISVEEMMRIWSLYSSQSMSALARSLNLAEEQMGRLCARHDISVKEKIVYPWKDLRVKALFADPEFQTWVSSECLRQRNALWQYLERIGFEPEAGLYRLMVDIGWRGSIQDNLAFLVNGQLDGVYLALYEFLAEQPVNARKHGFLMNRNRRTAAHLGDFASLEFISNGPGGSVVGYKNGVAVKERFEGEEQVIVNDVLPVQDQIVERIREIAPVLIQLPLDLESLGEVARIAAMSYVDHPDREIADMFQDLEHNETFGSGEVEIIATQSEQDIAQLRGSALHHAFESKLAKTRWPQAWVKSSECSNIVKNLDLDQRLVLPRGIVRDRPAIVKSLGQQISIFAPTPIPGSGGHRTIYNLAKALDAAGYKVHLFSEQLGSEYWYKEQELSGSGVKLHERWFSGIIPDVAIATIQHSVPYLSEFFDEDVKKLYFIQDFEAYFNPVSDASVRGENSFAEGHIPLCVGRWLTHVLRAQYGTPAASAGLGVDTQIYRPLEDELRCNRVVVLYQPEKWRRLPELSLDALMKVRQSRPDVEIVFYGSNASPNVPFKYTHLGLVNDLEDLNKLYNSAKVGLCVSLTNPSRIPYEMMAAGCVPVDVYRYNNLFDYENGTGLLAYQSADSLADAILHLLEDEERLRTRRENSIRSSSHRTLAWEADAAVNAVEHILEGGNLDSLPMPQPTYGDKPFLASCDRRPEVRAWCEWQKHMANDGAAPAEIGAAKR